VDDVAKVWELSAPSLFGVTINSTIAEGRLQNFVGAANLSAALLGNATAAKNVSFYALSLKTDGTPVEASSSQVIGLCAMC
jgi:hypothetical protein